ncbi:Terpenoid synthase 8 [Bienertia sinuspersici]
MLKWCNLSPIGTESKKIELRRVRKANVSIWKRVMFGRKKAVRGYLKCCENPESTCEAGSGNLSQLSHVADPGHYLCGQLYLSNWHGS